MSQEAILKKQAEVSEVVEKINKSVSTVVVEYAGLSVEDIKALRHQLREENVELQVLKNNISRRAFQEANLEAVCEDLKGPCAIAFSYEDVTAAARILNNFSKDHDVLKLKVGSMEGQYASEEQIKELATLPNREGLLSMLLSVLQAPMRGLAQTLSQIAEQGEQESDNNTQAEVPVQEEESKTEEVKDEVSSDASEEAPQTNETTASEE